MIGDPFARSLLELPLKAKMKDLVFTISFHELSSHRTSAADAFSLS